VAVLLLAVAEVALKVFIMFHTILNNLMLASMDPHKDRVHLRTKVLPKVKVPPMAILVQTVIRIKMVPT
jgi:hypothetical protein